MLTTSTARMMRLVSSRTFSTNCAPAEKLRHIFEEYRLENYAQETPYRFKKEMISAAQRLEPHKDGEITVDSINQVLVNIGQTPLSSEELDTILADVNAADRSIPVDEIMNLM